MERSRFCGGVWPVSCTILCIPDLLSLLSIRHPITVLLLCHPANRRLPPASTRKPRSREADSLDDSPPPKESSAATLNLGNYSTYSGIENGSMWKSWFQEIFRFRNMFSFCSHNDFLKVQVTHIVCANAPS